MLQQTNKVKTSELVAEQSITVRISFSCSIFKYRDSIGFVTVQLDVDVGCKIKNTKNENHTGINDDIHVSLLVIYVP